MPRNDQLCQSYLLIDKIRYNYGGGGKVVTKISEIITDILLRSKVIKKEDYEIYRYGYEIGVSTLTSIIVVLLIGIFWGKILETCIFLIVFSSSRIFCGGFHAHTEWHCKICYWTMYILTILLVGISNQMPYMSMLYLLIGILIVTCIFLYAPIENVNKPLLQEEKREYRKKSFAIVITFLVCATITYKVYYTACSTIMFSLLIVGGLMIYDTQLNKNGGVHNEGKNS